VIALLFAQLAIVTHVPDSVAACDAVEVTVAVSAPGSATPQIIPPRFAPFDVLRSSATPHVQLDPRNGGSIIAEYRYVLTTEQSGTFTLAPFEARLNGEVVRSRPLRVVVRGSRVGAGVPTVVARARIDTSLEVNFRALTEPETVYVGQQANYEVAVFLNETVRERLRRNPTFFPPDMQAMLAYDLPLDRGDTPRRKVGTRCFDALVYQRALFPLVAGRFVIPPAQLVYSLPLSASFFSREETHDLQTDSTIIVAIEPPGAGRPADFTGAVGALSIASRLDAGTGRVGDPLLLTVRLSGTGNVKLFPPPRVAIPWASIVPSGERVQVDPGARRIRGSKEFDWVLTPRIAGELDLPPIRYTYFNPDKRRYEATATQGARVRVAPGTLAAVDTNKVESLLALRTEYRGPVSPPPHQQPFFWALLAVAPLPAVTLRARRRKRTAPPTAATVLRSLERTPALARDPCNVRRSYAHALAERLGLSPETLTRPGALARALRRSGVSVQVASDAERFLRALDEAAYSPSATMPDGAVKRAQTLYRAVDEEALPKSELRLPPTIFVLLLCGATSLGATTLAALVQDDATRDFDRGVAAYQARRFVEARNAFAAVATAEPWAPDAWANQGTAAWAAGDTATAAAAWQRALRLQPLAADARERLDLVHTATFGALGWVPPVPVTALLWSGALLWCIAWVLAALTLYASRKGTITKSNVARLRAQRRLSYVFGTVAVLALLVALDVDQRAAARSLSVLRTSARLSSDPALGGETTGSAVIGEVARVSQRQGAWSRVVLDGDREGWVESSALISLERGVSF
jgi:tetratricopeptide (TPR) repeat protein